MRKIRAWFDRQNKVTQNILEAISYGLMFIALTLIVGLFIKHH
jgi:hypothetical protein